MSGSALKDQVEAWAQYGTIEKDAALSLQSLCDGSIDLSNNTYVLIGAGSAMGPYAKLLEHGACVICIDIPGKWGERPAAMWKRLIDIARKSSGSIIFPISGCTQCKHRPQQVQSVDAHNVNIARSRSNRWMRTV